MPALTIRMPSRLEVHATRSEDMETFTGVRWDVEVHGYVIDVTNEQPTRVRTHGVYPNEPTKEDTLSLLMTWFEHEMREQLGMDPHRPYTADELEPAGEEP